MRYFQSKKYLRTPKSYTHVQLVYVRAQISFFVFIRNVANQFNLFLFVKLSLPFAYIVKFPAQSKARIATGATEELYMNEGMLVLYEYTVVVPIKYYYRIARCRSSLM